MKQARLEKEGEANSRSKKVNICQIHRKRPKTDTRCSKTRLHEARRHQHFRRQESQSSILLHLRLRHAFHATKTRSVRLSMLLGCGSPSLDPSPPAYSSGRLRLICERLLDTARRAVRLVPRRVLLWLSLRANWTDEEFAPASSKSIVGRLLPLRTLMVSGMVGRWVNAEGDSVRSWP